jgi:hypothetical protein
MEKIMNKLVLGASLAAVSLTVFALETIQLGNLRITCPNQCVQVRNGDNISVSDSKGAQIEIVRLDQEAPLDP